MSELRNGSHRGVAYSRVGRTNVLSVLSMTSLVQLMRLHLRKPRVLEALAAVSMGLPGKGCH